MKTLAILITILIADNTFLFGQNSGVFGKVIEVTGNQMPSTSKKQNINSKGVIREIFIYEVTAQNQAKNEGVFYKNITTRLIAKKKTKQDGSFKLKLKPGRYSIFVKEKQGLFANSLDGEGNINAITIEPKKMTELNLIVDYGASY